MSVPFHIFSDTALQRVGGPPTLKLDLRHEPSSFYGLSFATKSKRDVEKGKDCDVVKSHTRLIHTIWGLTACLTFVVALMVFGLLYWSYRFNNNVSFYSEAAAPYIEEVQARGMSMLRHADNSSAALENVMAGAEQLTLTSIPALMESVNRTTAMVARLEAIAHNPTIKLSMA